ncbi:hypothetical protein Pla108_38250 [Botrimarina colliarenosi]|uniref:Uncharacterized protein n=1 Tax=Botrimarina colliarenosi TaxID=2528001 RepID=A0A5C6A6Z3_9BACT|nr:hypothetical protein Pla108_38250 [Botrimarina colliarenosi]
MPPPLPNLPSEVLPLMVLLTSEMPPEVVLMPPPGAV